MSSADSRRRVAIAGLLTAAFMIAEIVGGVISSSLALLADAAHMLTDAGSSRSPGSATSRPSARQTRSAPMVLPA